MNNGFYVEVYKHRWLIMYNVLHVYRILYYLICITCTLLIAQCTLLGVLCTLAPVHCQYMKKKKVKNSLKFLFCILLENWSFIILRIQFHREMKILYPSVLQIRGENREGLQGCQWAPRNGFITSGFADYYLKWLGATRIL